MKPAGVGRRAVIAALPALALPWAARAADIRLLPAGTQLSSASLASLEGPTASVPLAGKPTIVNFWATWCAPCRVEMPLLQQLAELYAGSLVLQAVNFKERAAAVLRHARASGWNMPVLLDAQGELARNWGVRVFPTTFGFDAAGRARWRVTGEYDWSSLEAGRLAEFLLERKT